MGNQIKRVIIVLLSSAIVCLVAWASTRNSQTNAAERKAELNAAYVDRAGIWNRAAYLRWDKIGVGTNRISDSDFNWLIGWITGKENGKGEPAAVASLVVAPLVDDRLTPEQKQAAQSAAIMLLTKKDPLDTPGLMQESGCKVLEKYPDRRAVPQLLELYNSTRPWVKRHAALALVALGFKVEIPPVPKTT